MAPPISDDAVAGSDKRSILLLEMDARSLAIRWIEES